MNDEIIERALYAFFAILGLATLWLLFVVFPMYLRAEARCLERGYPKSAVTWNLKSYCMNLDGSVTVKVESLDANHEAER